MCFACGDIVLHYDVGSPGEGGASKPKSPMTGIFFLSFSLHLQYSFLSLIVFLHDTLVTPLPAFNDNGIRVVQSVDYP